MTRLRALLFNTLFYGVFVGYMIVCLFIMLLPHAAAIRVVRSLMRNELRLQRLFGLKVEVRGKENMPTAGGIIAAKHQSMWETFALLALVPFPAFVYKKELDKVPLFGSYMRNLGMIPIDRKGGAASLRALAVHARAAIDNGRQVVIFPEGTRREPGAPAGYKFGVAKMYAATGRPVTPMVLNSGMYWSSYFWRGHPGTIIVEFLPPIPAGLTAEAFFEELTQVMEAASDRILLETARRPDAPPLGRAARERVAALEGHTAAPAEAS